MKSRLFAIVVLGAMMLGATASYANDTPAPSANDKLKGARAQIAAKNWNAAIAELRSVNDPSSAEWNNLMGYALRKSATPDYAAAEKHYDEALRLDPKHRGALEYSGELYLLMGNLPKAEERLASLNKICFLPCEEYTDLKRAVERYKGGAR